MTSAGVGSSRLTRFAPLSGIGFVVLWVVGFLLTESNSPDFVDKPSAFSAYFTDHKGSIIAGSWIALIAVAMFIWFLGSLSDAVRRAEAGEGRLARLVLGGGLVGSALVLLGLSLQMSAALRVDDRKSIDSVLAAALGDISTAAVFIAAPVAFSVMFAGVALAALRTGVLPAWLGWVSALLAVVGVVVFVSWLLLAFFVLPLWTLVVAILLFRAQPAAAA